MMLTVAAVLMMIGGVNAQTATDVGKKFNAAAELINGKKYAEAIPVLQEAIDMGVKVGPDALATVQSAQKLLPQCYFRKAIAAAQGAQFDTAVADLTKAAELGELYGDLSTANNAKRMISQVYTAMGASAFNAKDYAKAAEVFSKGYAANPNDTKLGLNLAMSYCELGLNDSTYMNKGLDVYKNIIALESRHSKYKADAATAKEKVVYYLMLNVPKLAEEKNYEEIMKVAEHIVAIDSTNAQGNLLRVQTATNMKDWDKVIELGDATAALQPTPELQSDAYFLLGAAYQNKENKAKAIETYKKVTAGSNVETAKAQITLLSK